MSRCRAWVLLPALLLPGFANAQNLDVLIRNGTVYDGSGAAPVQKDVGIRGGRIVLLGASKGATAKTVIDAKGLAVAPGFIDAHNHQANSVVAAPAPFQEGNFLTQGVTTMVLGPDGYESPTGLRSIFAALKEKGTAMNYACYIGHNGIRLEVMGHAQRAPTADELAKMKTLVREGMKMGCVGLSAGLMYDPGMFSRPDEIVALAKEVKPFNGTYDSHSRNPVAEFLKSELETAEIGVAAGIPAKLGHVKSVGLDNKGKAKELVAAVEALRAKGHDIVGDAYPYDGAATARLSSLFVFPDETPAFRGRPTSKIVELLRAAMADPAKKAEVKATTENGIKGGFSWVKAVGWQSIRIVDAPGQPELQDKYLSAFAKERGVDPFDLLAELVTNAKGEIIVTLGGIDEADLRELLVQPWVMIASDGFYVGPDNFFPGVSPHPRSTGTFTRVLGHYSRDVKLFPLAEAVRKMTSLPAQHLRLYDRGLIKTGYAADITIFDPATVADKSTYVRPDEFSTGIVDVLVGGELVVHGGQVTGVQPGKFIVRQEKKK